MTLKYRQLLTALLTLKPDSQIMVHKLQCTVTVSLSVSTAVSLSLSALSRFSGGSVPNRTVKRYYVHVLDFDVKGLDLCTSLSST